jgi:hypothetical protein
MQSHQQQVCVLRAPCTATAVGRVLGSNSSSYGSWALIRASKGPALASIGLNHTISTGSSKEGLRDLHLHGTCGPVCPAALELQCLQNQCVMLTASDHESIYVTYKCYMKIHTVCLPLVCAPCRPGCSRGQVFWQLPLPLHEWPAAPGPCLLTVQGSWCDLV